MERYIEERKDYPIKVSELSREVGINERSLHRLFNDRYGISPKSYLNRLRLNGIRHELKHTSSRKKKINEIAYSWGFWHMGQFAADYKMLFGELPSETLLSK